MSTTPQRAVACALALTLGLSLAGCGGMPENRSLYSVRQPVVERSTVALDVTTSNNGLPVAEQRRVAAWFEAMDLRYGDRISVEDPLDRPETRAAVAEVAGRYGLLLTDGAPVVAGEIQPGQARVVIARSRASVPGCPDWSEKSDANLGNGISANYGCANNGNLAAMVANPEDLIKGQKGSPDTYISTSGASIKAYKEVVGTKAGVTAVPVAASTGGN
ncbi:MAG TPA: CpaD family pilus assembly protein [Qipengyuania sp.]|nr:CpaD family pilus assembly protein [Qipengyuania sp.]